MDETKDMLTRQIEAEIEKLSTMEDGSEEKTATVNGINQLYRLKLEETRMEIEFDNQQRTQKINYILEGAKVVTGIASGIIIPVVFLRKGFKFEETGTYTSKTFQTLFNKFKLK